MKFETFIKSYSFRTFNEELEESSDIIRVYFGFDDYDWFEFGMYDFDSSEDAWKRAKRVLNPKILTMDVMSIRCDVDRGQVEIYLNPKTGGVNE